MSKEEILEFNEANVKSEIEKIRPVLQRDGGDIEFVGIEDKVVRVRLQGACSGCAMATVTLQWTVERNLKSVFPEMEKVENVR
ncbi:MAG: NifU family protein [Candidatus Fermentibacteraceae bacterium]|nr:NifU family protein [Candidatus Fermentibacteraceae bacterium]MBN2608272.1 NifU family protein [Candidatus Fermentibacteraceae bacterium]